MTPVPAPQRPGILLTGATGYVGGRLLRALEERGGAVRCLTRRPEAVVPHREHEMVVAGDVLDARVAAPRRCEGVETAYYLVHSMSSAASSSSTTGAGRPSSPPRPARPASVGSSTSAGSAPGRSLDPSREPSGSRPHPRGAPACETIEFRASIVIGSGSLSFEMRAQAGRAPAGDDHAPLGAHQGAADRDRGRARLPRRRARPATRTAARCSRSAAPTSRRLRRADARVRAAARPAPLHHPGAVAHRPSLEPLARARDARSTPASAAS